MYHVITRKTIAANLYETLILVFQNLISTRHRHFTHQLGSLFDANHVSQLLKISRVDITIVDQFLQLVIDLAGMAWSHPRRKQEYKES